MATMTATAHAAPKHHSGLTGAHDEWVQDTLGVNPKTYKAKDLDAEGNLISAKPANDHHGHHGAAAHATPTAAKPAAGTPAAAPAGKIDKLKNAGKAIKNFANEHCKVEVKQVKEDPPTFALVTTINFKGGLDKSGSKSFGDDKKGKLDVSAGVKVEAEVIASYTDVLSQDEAAAYIKCVEDKGKGGKFPAHLLLVTGFTKSWQAAKDAYQNGAGTADVAKRMQPGSSMHKEATAGASGNIGIKGEKDGYGVGVEANAGVKHKNVVDMTATAEGMLKVTAAVDDDKALGGKVSATYKGAKLGMDESMKSSKGQTVVLVLDPKSKEFDEQIKQIGDAKSYQDLTKLAERYKAQLDSVTERRHAESAGGGTAGYKGADAHLHSTSTVDETKTTNADGSLRSFDTTGTLVNHTEVSKDKHKMDFAKGSDHHGTVKGDTAEGVLGESGMDAVTSIFNAAKAVMKGGLKALDKPEDFMAEDGRHSGKLDYGDEDLMALCQKAQNASKWNGFGGSENKALWAQVGGALRDASTVENYRVTKINKVAVEQALTEWMASGSGEAMKAIDRALRTAGEAPRGHAESFPKGTEKLKPVWEENVAHNPLTEIKAKLAKAPDHEGVKEAATALKALHEKLKGLLADLKKNEKLWVDAEVRFAEMVDLITSRLSDIDMLVHDLKKMAAAPAGASGKGAPAAAEDMTDLLGTYKNELAAMQTHHDKIWQVLKVIEKASRPKFNQQFMQDLNGIEHDFFIWNEGYGRTDKLFQKLKPTMHMDEEALWKLDPKDTVAAYNQAKKMVFG